MKAPQLRFGVLGGLLGGLVFAGIMVINGTLNEMGMLTLPLIGRVVGRESAWIGLLVHLASSAVIGAVYVIAVGRFQKGMVDGLHLGLMYGAFWWIVGPFILLPTLLGEPIQAKWTFDNMLHMFPSFVGHVIYGAILALTVGASRDASLPVEEGPRARRMPKSEQTTQEMERPPAGELRKHLPLFVRRRPAPGTEEPGDDR